MTELYLGLWKNLSYLEPIERAAIVLALKPVLIFAFLLLILLLRRVLIKLFFVVINKLYELMPSRKSFEKRAAVSNRISDHFETIYGKVSAIHTKRWGVCMLIFAAVYYVMRLLIVAYAPEIGQTEKQTYLGSFISSEAEKYQNYEKEMLQKANAYQPLIPVDSQAVKKVKKSNASKTQHKKKLWLSLSKKGRKGIRVKKKPTKKAKKIAYISGKDKVQFLSKNKKGWVKVKLKNGKKGWVKQAFLKGVPD